MSGTEQEREREGVWWVLKHEEKLVRELTATIEQWNGVDDGGSELGWGLGGSGAQAKAATAL